MGRKAFHPGFPGEPPVRREPVFPHGFFSNDPVIDMECRIKAERVVNDVNRLKELADQLASGIDTDFRTLAGSVRDIVITSTILAEGASAVAALREYDSQREE